MSTLSLCVAWLLCLSLLCLSLLTVPVVSRWSVCCQRQKVGSDRNTIQQLAARAAVIIDVSQLQLNFMAVVLKTEAQ